MIRSLLLCLGLAPFLHAAPIVPATPGIGAAVDWLVQIRMQVDALTTATDATLLDVGWKEADFLIGIGLVWMVIRWGLERLDFRHHQTLHVSEVVVFLYQSLFVCYLLSNYTTPIPGLGLNVHQIFPALGLLIEQAIDTTALNQLHAAIKKMFDSLQEPGFADVWGGLVYIGVYIDMGVLQLALFVVDAAAAIFLGLLTMFGPLFIPLFLTKHFAKLFWAWLESSIAFGFYGPVSAGIVFIYGNLFLAFFSKSVAGDYSIGNMLLLAPILVVLTASLLLIALQIPSFVGRLVGGVGDMGQSWSNSVQRTIASLAS